MGKAFTQEERMQVQEKLRRAGIRLFRDNGISGVSIRQLTAAAGIAQGGFYTFYRDKYDFLVDITELRVREKLAVMEKDKERSLEDPAAFLAEQMYSEGMRLTANKAFDNEISDTLGFYFSLDSETSGRIQRHYRVYLEKLIEYWQKNGFTVNADVDGLLAAVRMEGIMITNASYIDSAYMSKMYRAFCNCVVGEFMTVGR
ncbi:MAG: TetR/AcrR family transcriptional regulator [Lachnospiraceae bacterium]|nr:TetR/AcrR family transcriptional regulator [Lachnospiraceae bacterium]